MFAIKVQRLIDFGKEHGFLLMMKTVLKWTDFHSQPS
jgi:hypothetical protein